MKPNNLKRWIMPGLFVGICVGIVGAWTYFFVKGGGQPKKSPPEKE
jgi:hypothetical protein